MLKSSFMISRSRSGSIAAASFIELDDIGEQDGHLLVFTWRGCAK